MLKQRSPLTDDAVTRFRDLGWVKLPGLLDGDELAALRLAVRDAESGEDPEKARQRGGAEAVKDDPKYREMVGDPQVNLRLKAPALAAVARRLAPAAGRLMGAEEVRVWWDQTFVKPPARDGTRPTGWHQDAAYFPFDRRGALTFWIAVEDVAADMGALRFVPRSHRIGSLGALDIVGDQPPLEDVLQPEDFAFVDPVASEPLAAGDATVHDGMTLHGAGPNASDVPRRGWTIVYMPAATLYTGAPHSNVAGLGLEPRRPFDLDIFRVDAP